jgi:hypothetical protein
LNWHVFLDYVARCIIARVTQHIGVENNAAEAAVELGDEKTALAFIV